MNAPINALLLILFGSAIGFCEMLAQAFEPFITITNSVGMKLPPLWSIRDGQSHFRTWAYRQ